MPETADTSLHAPPAPQGSQARAGAPDGADFDLHGIVGIRVVGGTEADAATVDRQLGGLRRPLDRDPDIVVSFVEPSAASPDLRYLDLDDAAFDDDAFFVLQTRAGTRLK